MRRHLLPLAGSLALLASLLMPAALLAQPDAGETPGEPVASAGPAGDGEAPKDGAAEPGAPVEHSPRAGSAPPPEPTPPAEPAPAEPAAQQAGAGEPAEAEPEPRARAAQSATVRIGDFFFAPASITVDVGDTVTWVNDGEVPEGHTATAQDGSFDTGVLRSGESASHTFTRAGTFPYVCSLHPAQQRGTVTVRGAADPGAPDPTGGPAATADPDAGPAEAPAAGDEARPAAAAELAEGGWELLGPLLLGLALLALGAALRRRARLG